MTILVDTNVLVWLAQGNERLGIKARSMLERPSSQVCASYFSLLELTMKAALGKIEYDYTVLEDMALAKIRLLPADTEYLAAYKIYNQGNKDPFDNMLLAVAETEQCAFMTSDKRILNLDVPSGIKLLDARA